MCLKIIVNGSFKSSTKCVKSSIILFFLSLHLDLGRVTRVIVTQQKTVENRTGDQKTGEAEASSESRAVSENAASDAESTVSENASQAGGDSVKVNSNVTVSVSYDENAGLPEGTKLSAKEVSNADQYAEATKTALGKDVKVLGEKYYDISFEKDGTEIEPQSKVSVKITLSGDERMTAGNDVKVVHFADGNNTPDVLNATVTGGKTVETEAPATRNVVKRLLRAAAPKKAVDKGSDSVIEFQTESFSIYGIVDTEDKTNGTTYRRTYTFQNDDGSDYTFSLTKNPKGSGNETPVSTSTNQQIVKNGGQLLDVGVPAPVKKTDKNQEHPDNYGRRFLGWEVIEASPEVPDLKVGDIIDFSKQLDKIGSHSSDENVTVKAKFGTDVYVTFYDVKPDNGASPVLRTVSIPSGTSIPDFDKYTVIPASEEQGFLGWSTTETNPGTGQQGDVNVTSESIFNADTALYPVVATGHWLNFDKNDDDEDPTKASYTDSKFVIGNTLSEAYRPTENEQPKRAGYTFAGWYEKDNDTGVLSENEFSFTSSMTDNKTVYAKWTPNKVGYTIVYWQENPDDYGFSYAGSDTKATGIAGTLTSTEGLENHFEGFHLHSSDKTEDDRSELGSIPDAHYQYKNEQVVIKGDGTTVVNVYFDRNVYNVYFANAKSDSRYTQKQNGDYYLFPGGYIRTGSGRQIKYESFEKGYYKVGEGPWASAKLNEVVYYYTQKNSGGSRNQIFQLYSFTAGKPQGAINDLTITAKYGSDIEKMWPSRRSDISEKYQVVNWLIIPGGSRYQANISTMPLNGAAFFYNDEEREDYLMEINYKTQDTKGGDNFSDDHSDHFPTENHNKWSTTAEDYYNLKGFTPIFESKEDAGGVENYILKKDVPGVRNSSVKVGSKFEKSRSEMISNWNSIEVYYVNFYYARNTYHIDFYGNKGDDNDKISQSYLYEANISNADKTGEVATSYVKGKTKYTSNGKEYTFAGWYENPEGTGKEVDFSQINKGEMPANDLHFYAKWTTKQITVTVDPNGGIYRNTANEQVDKLTSFKVNYGDTIETEGSPISIDNLKAAERKDDQDNRNNYILTGWYVQNTDGSESLFDYNAHLTQDTTIKAHWKKAGAFKVRYIDQTNPDEEMLRVDEKAFADQAEVTVLEWPNGKDVPAGKQFIGWSIRKNGNLAGLYKPGDTFVLDANNASKIDETNDIYYVTLVAQYTSIGTTYIRYNPNGGTGTLNGDGITNNIQKNIPLNKTTQLSDGKGFTKEGYVLIGWNTQSDGKGTHWDCGEKVGVDSINEASENILYAEWAAPLTIKKTSENGNALLSGATFILKVQQNGVYVNVSPDNFYGDVNVDDQKGYSVTTGTDGEAVVGVLKPGSYELEETTPPEGYVITGDGTVKFTVNADRTIDKVNSTGVLTITNKPGTPLPNTGGNGTGTFTALGLLLLTAAGTLITLKKKSIL